MRFVNAQSALWLSLPLFASLSLAASQANAAPTCQALFDKGTAMEKIRPKRFQTTRAEVETVHHDMPGLKIASITDPSLSTGVTFFSFDRGATAAYDARGGSVASIETSLLDPGSYSNEVDGILFAGGSTMGLEATQGVRHRIFRERGKTAGVFDAIPSIPGAVVYDFGGRVEEQQNQLLYPGLAMGAAAYDNAVPNVMQVGRVGAGTTTTANKISAPIWGGQGAGYREIVFTSGFRMKLFTAVILNAHGNIHLPPGVVLDPQRVKELRETMAQTPKGHKQNTTLSIVITDVALDRSQLQRLATMVHTSMAGIIHPFHSYTDGDILFSVSMNKTALPPEGRYEFEEILQSKASDLMRESILRSVTVANKLGSPGEGLDL